MVPNSFPRRCCHALTYLKNPAFGAAYIRELTDIFIDKSLELRDAWVREIKTEETNDRINVLSWLSRMTLDVIGLAGMCIIHQLVQFTTCGTQVSIIISPLFRVTPATTNLIMPSRSFFAQERS